MAAMVKWAKLFLKWLELLKLFRLFQVLTKNTSSLNYPCYTRIDECKEEIDVILDFSRPDSLDSLCQYSKEKNIPIVFCTTGYTKEQLSKIQTLSEEVAVFHSANMSIGVNIINNMLKSISNMLYKDFDI